MTKSISKKEFLASQYLFTKTYNVDHSGGSFFSHLYNTFFILKEIGADEDTCLAGLYHSVYGNERFYFATPFTQDEIILQIGKDAERLVYYFCLPEISKIIFNNSLNLSNSHRLSLAQILYANEVEQNKNAQSPVFLSFIKGIKQLIEEIKKEMV